jgi:2'-5' RNA ligase
MRLFVAIELSPAVIAGIEEAVGPLRDLEPALAWVAAPKRHLTLKFIGDGDDTLAERLGGALDAVARAHRPFAMALEGIGAFPNFRRARVVWIGVAGEPRLELVHHDLELAAADADVEVEGRPFRPHVTVARVRSALETERARALARAARRIAFSATQEVTAITLFDSVPAAGGAHYRRVHTATLGGR